MGKHVRWTEHRILDVIQRAREKGLDLRTSKVQDDKAGRRVYRAACRQFGKWKNALEAAGIRYEQLNEQLKEEERKGLLEKIREAHGKGVRLDSGSIREDSAHSALYYAAQRLYSGRTFWEDALGDAGLDAAKIVIQKRWTRERVEGELRRRHAEGKPMNHLAVKKDKDEKGLCKAVRNHFGSWDDALLAIGLKPLKVRKTAEPYSAALIITNIIEHHLRGRNLNQAEILKDKRNRRMRRTVWVAIRRYGSWDAAVSAAGIDYSQYVLRKRGFWTGERIKERILELHSKGEPLNASHVSDAANKRNDLYRAAVTFFGSWKSAIEICGLDYDVIRKNYDPLSREEIIAGIKRLHEQGKGLNSLSVFNSVEFEDRRLYYQAAKRFGGWEEAVKAAGFDYTQIEERRKKYSFDELAAIVRGLEASGVSLFVSDIRNDPENKRYHSAALKRYDSWESFLDDIGLDGSKYATRTDWKDGEAVLEHLREMFPAGIVTGVKTMDPNLSQAAHEYFGGIEKAARKAGLVYFKNGGISKEMIERDPQIVRTLYEHNKEYLDSIAKRVFFGARKFGRKTLDLGDLKAEAFLLFCSALPEKPPKADLRGFAYKHIYSGLLKLNRSHDKEVLIGDERILDFFNHEADLFEDEG
ncbi:MAG: hypothetical protein V1827_04930 [Candidatus Micrarchaeota archaeon]